MLMAKSIVSWYWCPKGGPAYPKSNRTPIFEACPFSLSFIPGWKRSLSFTACVYWLSEFEMKSVFTTKSETRIHSTSIPIIVMQFCCCLPKRRWSQLFVWSSAEDALTGKINPSAYLSIFMNVCIHSLIHTYY